MYVITLDNGGTKTVIHEPGTSEIKVDSAKISREVNKFDSLSFDIYPNNPGYDLVNPFSTLVTVQNTKTGKVDFEGRVIQPVPSMDSDGTVMKSVTCESVMGYLCDSRQEWEDTWHYAASGGKSGLQVYLEKLLTAHNSKVEDYKKIYPGSITLQTFETSDGVTKGISRDSTWNNIEDKIIKSFGGEMRVRRGSDGLLYLDYAEKLGTTRATPISLAWNMEDAEREIDPNGVITRFYPYGAKITIEQEDPDTGETEEIETEERLTIESVNGGKKYIDDPVAMKLYGIIEGSNEWDDVTVASNLLTKAQEWLGANNALPTTHTFTALDLSLLGLDYDSFEIFDSYPCYNPLLDIDETLEIVKQTININEPENSSFDMGETSYRLSNEIGNSNDLSQSFEEFRGQTQTNITNVNNAVKSTKAAIKVFDDKIQQTVEEKVSQTTTQIVTEKVQEATQDLPTGIKPEFYLSTSATELSGGTWSETSPVWQNGKYIWMRTKTTDGDGDVSYSQAVCITGSPGQNGEDGESVTITGYDVRYKVSNSGTVTPSGDWYESVQEVPAGQYLWTRTTIEYSNGQNVVSYSVAYSGMDGSDGLPGAPGTSTYFHVAYANSEDGKTDFSTTDATGREYMGTYVDSTPADSSDPTKYTWALIKGQDGSNGAPGKDGSDGTTYYLHIAYATSSDGTQGFSTTDSEGKTYLGQCVNTTQPDPTSPTDYSWTKIKGDKGDQGIQGPSGKDGQTLYTWLKYADSPTSGMSDDPTGKKYIGLAYNKTTATESTNYGDYNWSLVKGADGAPGPSGDDGQSLYTWIKYATSASGANMSDSPDGKTYIGLAYNKTTATESSNPADYTWSLIKGADGKDGNGVKSTSVTYQASTSGTVVPTGTWLTYIPAVLAGQYLWTRTLTTYDDGSSTPVYSVGRMGENGTDGKDGKDGANGRGISGTTVTYQAGTSGTTAPTGNWTSGIPTVSAGQYLWTRTVTSYTDGSNTTSYSVGRMGENGAAGKDGKGISKTAVTYQAGTSGTTVPTGTWQTSVPSVAAGQYLWTRTITTYTDSSTTTAYSIGRMGQNGANGSDGKGVKSTAVTYQAGASQTSAPTGTWGSSVPTLTTALPYLWTRTVITYTDNSTSTSYSVSSTLESFEIGGRNLIRNSDFSYGTANWTKEGSATFDVANDDTYGSCAKYTATGDYSTGGQRLYSMPTMVVAGAMLSFMAKADAAATLNTGLSGQSNTQAHPVTTSWKKFTRYIPVNIPGSITFYGIGTFYITDVKLEKGNKATDWTPAPEDTDDAIGDVNDNLQGAINGVQDDLEGVASDLADTQGKVDETYELVTENTTQITELLQTVEGWDFTWQETTEIITKIENEVTTEYSERLKYIRFIDGEIWLGRDPDPGEDDFKVVISNERIRFLQNNVEVAYISNKQLYITNARITERLEIGNFAFFPRENGNMTLRYIG